MQLPDLLIVRFEGFPGRAFDSRASGEWFCEYFHLCAPFPKAGIPRGTRWRCRPRGTRGQLVGFHCVASSKTRLIGFEASGHPVSLTRWLAAANKPWPGEQPVQAHRMTAGLEP